MTYEEQQEIEIGWFNKCCFLNEKLFDYLKSEIKDMNPKKEYVLSYYQHVKKSTLGCVNIKLKAITKYNTSISLQSMMCETDKPFRLSLWKYNGEHTFKDYELKDISEKDFPQYLEYIREFFDLKPKGGYIQLTLF